MMKPLLLTLGLLVSALSYAQYYYKDIHSTRQTTLQLSQYKKAGIKSVTVTSFENDGSKTEDFNGAQTVGNNYAFIKTVFNTALAGESELTTYFNTAGQLVKSIDTTDGSGSVSEYKYDAAGRISSITNVSTSPGMYKEKEVHMWTYNENGQPQSMLRIKNDVGTAYITFVLDEKGNVAEENSRRNGVAQASYYYYYDDKNRLTDVVTYNQKAQRLLPIYIFEYSGNNTVSSMIVVPEGSDNYQRWVYEYNQSGLKTKETCFNKRRQMLGRIEYAYK